MTSLEELSRTARFVSREEYRPFPRWGESFPFRQNYVPDAEKFAGEPVLALPATRYMDFQRDGNRSRFEKLVGDNRRRLMTLALAECQEGKGRFIDPVIDRIWAMCEESTWVIPASLNQYPTVDCSSYELPHPDKYTYIDLSSAYSGAQLALILYLLRRPLERESPVLARRIEVELAKRLFDPYLGTDLMWWMGYTPHPVNNWNPWVNSNVMTAALLADPEAARREKVIRKALASAQKFYDIYPEDGGCDEGPSYFGVAGACLLDLCQIADSARCDGGESAFCLEKLPAMAGYISHMRIEGDLYVNYADATPHVTPPAGTLYRSAQALRDPSLEAFARSLPWGDDLLPLSNPWRVMRDLLSPRPEPMAPVREPGWYFPGIQVCVGRTEHLFFSAKGGHNAESHNHNDVGNYILYADGKPVVVDIGPTQYTRATFSGERWSIFTFCSPYHNTLIPKGCQQPPVREAAARDVRQSDDGNTLTFSLDMAGAYPPEAGLASFVRTFTLDRQNESLTIREDCRGEDIQIPIILAQKPALEPGRAVIGDVELTYDPARLEAKIEEFELYDDRQKREWGRDTLWRLLLCRPGGGEWAYRYQYKHRRNEV